ncbi:hypothetical protein J3R82DRAFT_2125, partial [Butyriboletus roseoflavus]
EELEYLKDCASEPQTALVSVAYVKELQKLQFAEKTYGSVTQSPYLTYTASNFTSKSGLNQTAQQCLNTVSTEYSLVQHKYKLQLNVVEHFEWQHNIHTCWTLDDPEYVAIQDYTKHCSFIHVIKELKGLVVQHLFELSKANLAGIGYKMCKHMSKALTCCSTAIHRALECYNKLAPCQKLPHLRLEYSNVIGYSILNPRLNLPTMKCL